MKLHSGQINKRRAGALKRLEAQLISGVRRINPTDRKEVGLEKDLTNIFVALSPVDIKRINKEISILKDRIVNQDVARSGHHKKYRGAR